ncbi:MAG: DUF5916 domain-containing protein [Gemmatimonadales bacterium]
MRAGLFLTLAALGATAAPAASQEGTGPNPTPVSRAGAGTPHAPNIRPSLAIRRAPGAVTVDGRLDDAGWANAARATNFSEFNPRDLGAPSVETEAWVTYDQEHLYVAIMARDDPSSIRSSLTDRDRIGQDDYVGVVLDTYGDASWAYLLFANPRGIQADRRYAEGRGDDARMDIIYHSRGRVTDDGYLVEMAIPFSSLRFPPRPQQEWRVTFWRNRPRTNREEISWAGLSRKDPCMLCQMGTLTGLEGVRPGGSLEVLPSVVGSQSGALGAPGEGFVNSRVTGDAGVSAKYSFANGLTAEATINPDFSQVESDAGQVDVNSTFALFFPEQRTFFQEGSDLFSTRINAVYTRSINNPIAAGKLIGRMGRTTVAYLGARDDHSPLLVPFEERSVSGLAGKSVSNVLRFRQTFGRNSYLGALVTDRRMDGGGSGSVVGIDGMVGFGGVYSVNYQVLGSHTAESDAPELLPALGNATFAGGRYTARLDGERFSGLAQQYSLARNARGWNWDATFRSVSPTFRADNGFESRNDLRQLMSFQAYNFYPNGRVVKRISPSVMGQRTWNFDGDIKSQAVEARLNANLVGQTFVQVNVRTADERFRGVDFRGLQRVNINAETNFTRWLSVGGSVGVGDGVARNLATPLEGRMTDVNLRATLRPSTWASFSPSVAHSRMARADGETLYSGYILRTRADLQFTRELFLRMVVQYNNFSQSLSIEPLVTYRASPFTMVYIGSTRGYRDMDEDARFTRTSTQYFTKVQYLLRK